MNTCCLLQDRSCVTGVDFAILVEISQGEGQFRFLNKAGGVPQDQASIPGIDRAIIVGIAKQKLRFLTEQTRFMDLDMDEFSTAGDPMGGGYTEIASSMGGGEFTPPAAVGGAGAVFWMWVIALLGSVNAFVDGW